MSSSARMSPPARITLSLIALLWLILEWALALPPLLRQGFRPWHEQALRHLRADTAFQLVALDYALAYAAAFTLSLADARRRSRRWGWWAAGFLLFTAPAIVFYWANRSALPERESPAGEGGPRVEL